MGFRRRRRAEPAPTDSATAHPDSGAAGDAAEADAQAFALEADSAEAHSVEADSAEAAGAAPGAMAGDGTTPAGVPRAGGDWTGGGGGPWDAEEVDLAGVTARDDRIDLGGLVLPAVDGMQLQLQVDQGSGVVTSVLLVLADSAVQLLAVAAPRSGGLWESTRAQVVTDATRRGGTAREAVGAFGPELQLTVPVRLPDGRQAVQPSRVAAVDGPRWLLRATFLGRAVTEEDAYDRLVGLVRQVVVVRGGAAMPPGELIPLRVPEALAAASPDSPPGERAAPTLEDLDPGPTITEIR